MKKLNALAFILLAISITSCSGTKENFFSINESALKEKYTPGEVLSLEILNPKKEKIDSVVYSINDKKMKAVKGSDKFSFELKNQKLGYQNIIASIFHEGETESDSTRVELVSDIEPKMLTYTIVNTYPHDIKSFTEGLEFYKDTLYESAGQYGESRLLKTDYKTGKILKSLALEDKYFGEGITFINDKIYQLTYKEQVGFIYDAKTWKLEKTFPYDKPEGWGMTNDGKNILFNDSSEKIWKMDPNTQKTTDYINVYLSDAKVKEVNELEWVDGKLYSNVWQKDVVVVINPNNGSVEAVINFAELKKKLTPLPDTDVLNGIAYNPKTKTFFITGKNWDKMFEVKINQ